MKNVIGIIVVIAYIVFVMGSATILKKKKKLSVEGSRKWIHVLLCHTFFMAIFFFDNVYWACALPLVFIFVNLGSHFFRLFPAMEREHDTLGTVWYAVSLTILVYLAYRVPSLLPYCAIATLALGYGDGLAGVIGVKKNRHPLNFGGTNKTLEGSATVLLVTFLASFGVLFFYESSNLFFLSFIIGVVGMILECVSLKGTDNLTLPLGIVFLGFLLTKDLFPIPIILPFAIAAFIFFFAYGAKKLTLGGGLGAVLLAVVTIFCVGYPLFFALVFFLISSNVLEKVRIRRLGHLKKEGARNIKQVVANGLPCFFSAILYGITGHDIFFLLSFVSVAASTSDTWSGEIGMMGKEKVRGIITHREMEKGLSGGVTKLGFLGGILGSASIALFLLGTSIADLPFAITVIIIFGCFSSIVDSIIGDLFQGKFYDQKTHTITEDKHQQGTVLEAGIAWVSNNIVNLTSNLISCGIFFLSMLIKYQFFM